MKALQVNPHYKQLNAMKGKSFMYMGRTIHIDYWHEQDDAIHIVADTGREIIIANDNLQEELSNFLPVEGDASESAMVLATDAHRMNSLEQVLMESIEDIRSDKPNAIPKAKQIASTSNTLLNLTKTKIKMLKEMRS